MNALTTQEALITIHNDPTGKPHLFGTLNPSISTVDSDDYRILKQQYGACWGTLKFEDSPGDYTSDPIPFLYVDDGIELNLLRRFMKNEWKLQMAKIVIPVLSGVTNHKPIQNKKIAEALRSGIKSAANSSEVWFITNGIDAGISQLIGTAFREEIKWRRPNKAWADRTGDQKISKDLVLIGIVCDDEIKNIIDELKLPKDKSTMEVKMPARKPNQLSLNSDHTHFIIIREQPIGNSSTNFVRQKSVITESGEKQLEKLIDSAESATNKFRDRFEAFIHRNGFPQQPSTSPTISSPTTDDAQTTSSSLPIPNDQPLNEDGFPMVCILIRGTPGTIELLYKKIQQDIPAVIFKGTGSAADIIAFAYEEISVKNDKEYEDSYLKVELARRLLNEYPALKNNDVKRNEIRDHIIEIVKKADQEKQTFLTFVDMSSTTTPLNDFHKFILSALLQSQKFVQNTVNAQMKRNLLLTLDWNLSDLALSEIFQRNEDIKYSIPHDLFEKAILGRKREGFVDLFLDREFLLHQYLTSDKLVSLFNQTKDDERDFLTTTSLESILSETGDEEEMPDNFIEEGLNRIVECLTGVKKLFDKRAVDDYAKGIYSDDKTDKNIQTNLMRAEKKALRHLIIYAVLTNRFLLAKILWKRSSEPIHMALICYMMYKHLAFYCHESYQRLLIEKQAIEFSDCAVGVLNKSFTEDCKRTFLMLTDKHLDWNNMSPLELAYRAKNKAFMAHAACQKWVTRQFFGEITPRGLSWGLFRCPLCFKIITSACLIFPMWFWINFSPIGQALKTPTIVSDLKDEKKSSGDATSLKDPQSKIECEVVACDRKSSVRRMPSCFHRNRRNQNKNAALQPSKAKPDGKKPLSCIEKIKTLWSAPITKFCVNFASYLVYLAFFTLAVMWPSCGNLLLDCFVWFWTLSITIEDARVTYKKYRFHSLPYKRAVIEVIAQVIFLALYLGVRIIGLWKFDTCQILTAKAILGIGLIYYFCRILFIYFPIDPKLGPLMIRLRCMVMDDFITFLQLFMIFMISSGVAITAVLYPHYPIGLDLFSKAFVFRGLMTMFSSEMRDFRTQRKSCSINATSDIDTKDFCSRLSHGSSYKYDNLDAYNRYGISSPRCNEPSWIAWFLLIQYFFLAKRFLISLLTAMFGLTGARVQRESEQIWMYDRYAIVVEYAKRPRLPPPFVVISDIGMLFITISRQCVLKLKNIAGSKNTTRRRRLQSSPSSRGGDVSDGISSATTLITVVNRSTATQFSDNSAPASDNDRSLLERLFNCKSCRRVINHERDTQETKPQNWEDNEASVYWKYKAKEYYAETQEADEVQEKLDNLWNSAVNEQKDMDVLRKSLRQINDRVVSLEKLMINSHLLLEKLRTTIHQEDKSLLDNQKFIHVLSRESPYIYTNQTRFPVTEKSIPWTVPVEFYDPTLTTLPKEHSCFRDDKRLFVEPNLLKLSATADRSGSVTSVNQLGIFEAMEPPASPVFPSDVTTPAFEYKWNEMVEFQLPDGKMILIDRTSWVANASDKTPVIYQLDTQSFIPLNPMGRTGVCGRGALVRWGPNKCIMVIITRWKRHGDQFVIVDGHRILEAMVFKDEITNGWKLPGGKILGFESPYGAVCRSFNKLAFQDDDSEHSLPLEEQDMIEYFESFARSSDSNEQSTDFKSHMVYRGYIDDVRNTDNAWVEAEIWNFHYGSNMSFPRLRNDNKVLWKDVAYNSRGFLMQTSILHEIARIHDAYFD